MNTIDISIPLHSDIPTWPGSPGIRLHWYKRLDAGDDCNNSRFDCDTHVGTHVGASVHFFEVGASVEQLSPEVLIGPAIVRHLPDVSAITAADLGDLALPSGTQRLLLRTPNSELWAVETTGFKKDYVALSRGAAQWIVSQGIRLIGVDYLSVGSYEDGTITHQILLGAGVVVLEEPNLYGVNPGECELVCLPLKLVELTVLLPGQYCDVTQRIAANAE